MHREEYKQVRRDLGLTQAELAERLGVARNTVSRRELGTRPITREAELAIRRLAAAGGCTARTGAGPRESSERRLDMRYDVEEHVIREGRAGMGQGPATGTYGSEEEALAAMAEGKARGNGMTCIVRDETGHGTMHLLGLVRAIPEDLL